MKKILSAILAAMMTVTVFTFTAAVSAKEFKDTVIFSFNYGEKNDGVVDHKDSAILKKGDDSQGETALRVVPNLASSEKGIYLDCYSLSFPGEQVAKAKYVTVRYKYAAPAGVKNAQKMSVYIAKTGGAVTEPYRPTMINEIVQNNWAYALFDITALEGKIDTSGKLGQFHVNPYGDAPLSTLSEDEIFYISEVAFHSEMPEFTNPSDGEAAAVQSKPASGTSADGTITAKGEVVYSFNYNSKFNEIVDKKTSAFPVRDDQSQGETALKIVPNPNCTDTSMVALDCYSLSVTPEQLLNTKYITIKYKYVSPTSGKGSQPMVLALSASGGAVKSYSNFDNKLDMVANNWAYALFDISSVHANVVNEEGKKLSQIHIKPYGNTTVSSLTMDEVFYISEVAFHSEKPEIANPANGPAPEGTASATVPSSPDTPADSGDDASGDGVVFSFNYSDKNSGIVDHKNSAELTKNDESQGEKALKIVPNKTDSTESVIYLDCYSLSYPASELAKVKYVSVRYKYVVPENVVPSASEIQVNLLPNGKALKGAVGNKALLKENEWTEAYFDVSALINYIQIDGIFRQFHISPFGTTSIESLKEGEVMYISDIKFHSRNPDVNATYSISFVRGNPDADGTNPETLNVKNNQEYTLPECPYTLKNGEFTGWLSSYDNKLYKPGTKITAVETSVKYTAQFEESVDTAADSISLKFSDYCNGIVDHKTYGKTENVVFQGKDAVKLSLAQSDDPKTLPVTLDGWSYGGAGINLERYKYLVIDYYFEGTLEKPAYMKANYMKSSILTKAYGNRAAEPIVSGKWAYALIDLSGVDEVLLEGAENHHLRQMHIAPFDGLTLADLKGDEVIYISQLTFFKEKPDIIIVHESYMKGYDGGYFKPQGNMTRAEACTIVARLAAGSDALVPTDKTTAFTDVPATEWYHKYIAYVESLGYLKAYSGNFLPNQAITRAEFVELVYNMGLLKDAGKNSVFTDVAADHPRAAVIAAAGKAELVNGYDNGDGTFSFKPDATITRAEVVTVINNAYGRRMTADNLSADVTYSFFDVPNDFWAYADICEATLSHVQFGEKWAYAIDSMASLLAGSRSIDLAAGEAYVAELDKIAEQRKQEIRSTNSEVTVTGTKYYVDATNGNDANDGKSPETAWKTISKVNNSGFRSGDGIFFKRGDIYRERMQAKSGVTYSAYGEGDKPRFYGSPENGADPTKWTLMEGTNNIWVYATEMQDVGTIVLDFKEAALKEIPDLRNGEHYARKNDVVFDIKTELDENHEFYCEIKDSTLKKTGKIYFRCDEGNPGEFYKSIEFNTRTNVISGSGSNNVIFDNICVMFGGSHGIGYGTVKNLTVQNCEFGWIGGAIQHYNENGTVTRFGNAVEIYGGCDGYLIDNCYVYQCYDAGLTHQYKGGINDNSMYNITYSNNVIEDCIYSIEYFNSPATDGKGIRDGKNFKIIGNIMRRAGYGFGNQRPDSNVSSHIKGWADKNEYEKGTYIIENNVFDRGSWSLVQTQATYNAWGPLYDNNTYVQWMDGPIGYHINSTRHVFDTLADITIKMELGDNNAKVYWLPATYKHQGFLTR